jgi:hypothetical protein
LGRRRAGLVRGSLSACSAGGTTSTIHDSDYKAVWARDWVVLTADSLPYRPTATSPGVCNSRGVAQQCRDTDLAVAKDLNTLAADLRSVSVPAEYRAANTGIRQAIQLDVQGLKQPTPLF